VAFPTETVYGLGGDALNPSAVARIFQVKGRPADDPLIVHVLGAADLATVAASVPPVGARLAAAFWPGPLTLIVPRGPLVPPLVTAGLDTVAVRAPAHPVARALIAAAGTPVAAPSANRFGHVSPTTADHVLADLADRIDIVLDAGPTPVGVESTVVDCRADPPLVLRPGGVTWEALRAIVPGVRLAERRASGGPQRGPGQLWRHYAPAARLILLTGADEDVRAALAGAASHFATATGHRVGLLVAEEDLPAFAHLPPEVVALAPGPLTDPAGVARHLFAALRGLDAAGVQVILARDFGTAGLALAIRDRLARAAAGNVVDVAPGGAAEVVAAIVARVTDGR
jgi:L-threonylcarbamoyladenylate synthase